MPIITPIGRKSLKVRVVVAAIYVLLITGAVTMIYPLLLMLAGSIKSDTDFYWISPVPRYLWNDDILWMKYVESKYETIAAAETAYRRPIGSWRRLKPLAAEHTDRRVLDEFEAYRQTRSWPGHWFTLGHTQFRNILARNARALRRLAQDRFDNNLTAYSHAVKIHYGSWSQVGPPWVAFGERHFQFPQTENYRIYDELKEKAPGADWVIVDLDGQFWANYLRLEWSSIEAYNESHQSEYASFREVLLSARPPVSGPDRADWDEYVRHDLNLSFIRIDKSVTKSFQQFLRDRYDGDIGELNRYWASSHADFASVSLPRRLPRQGRAQIDLAEFVRSTEACPLEALSIHGPRQGFEQFVADRRGVAVGNFGPLPLPVEALDYQDFQRQKTRLRWEFVKRNYVAVFDYILTHGNGIRNTIIFCGLMVLAHLIVNPLAAYGLSRYQPPSTYQILLFCMCTMAFPAEVTMIPGFLLLKRFPLYSLAIGLAAAFAAAYVIRRARPALAEGIVGLAAALVGIGAGFWGAPWLARWLAGTTDPTISLLNTFWALILPAAANGFSIFLLKGFFDSLPRELYEAAEIDGAGEWTKFWTITMSLSKPILAVLALAAFTAAYSEFMMALVIIPDPDMWTIMIWLFQLQNYAHPSVVYASLVIAAVPTMLIFLFCQNIIMRGIVVPVDR